MTDKGEQEFENREKQLRSLDEHYDKACETGKHGLCERAVVTLVEDWSAVTMAELFLIARNDMSVAKYEAKRHWIEVEWRRIETGVDKAEIKQLRRHLSDVREARRVGINRETLWLCGLSLLSFCVGLASAVLFG